LSPYELEETSLDVEDRRNNVVNSVGPDNDDALIALRENEGGRRNSIALRGGVTNDKRCTLLLFSSAEI